MKPSTVKNDDWQTCKESWSEIAHILAPYKKRRIWQPFYYDGKCGEYLREIGFKKVTHSPHDFFKRCEDKSFLAAVDLIWDNPPYTNQEIKTRVLQTLAETGKPFIMLLPITTLHVKFVRELLDMSLVQCIIPRRVMVRKKDQESPVPFKYLCWLCYKTRFKADLMFV